MCTGSERENMRSGWEPTYECRENYAISVSEDREMCYVGVAPT